MEYSPIAALNRTYALSKANGKEAAILEAEKLNLANNHLYHSLLASLYAGIDPAAVARHLHLALNLAKNYRRKETDRGPDNSNHRALMPVNSGSYFPG